MRCDFMFFVIISRKSYRPEAIMSKNLPQAYSTFYGYKNLAFQGIGEESLGAKPRVKKIYSFE